MTKNYPIDAGTAPRIGIIGAGIAGLGAAYLLNDLANITIFEKDNRIGGHSNTVNVPLDDGTFQPVDTGFMVYNSHTYPNLCKLFKKLGIQGEPTDMSFSVTHQPDNVVWSGSSLNQIFGQRKNLWRPSFWQMVMDLKRLCEHAEADLNHPSMATWTIQDYITYKGFSPYLTQWFMLPMASAIWSTHPERILDFPARTLLRFYENHRFLRLGGHLQWFTVPGGSQTYVKKLTETFTSRIQQANSAVKTWQEDHHGQVIQKVQDSQGKEHTFDAVILACHADQSLALLNQPSALEAELLSEFPYEENTATLHTDMSVLPPVRRCWAAWNYAYTQREGVNQLHEASTHYWMNRLQHISGDTQYIVSINGEETINPSKVLATIPYTHPRYTLAGIAAQPRLTQLNQQHGLSRYFCGSYFKYGFHEDAFTSATQCVDQVVSQLTGRFPKLQGAKPWQV